MFCKCGTIIQPNKMKCNRCNEKIEVKCMPKIIEKHFKKNKNILIEDRGAKIKNKCENCGNEEMYYKTVQLRAADEGQTIFYECECGFKTRVNS